jgi:uracil-DNA glycosylase family protein
VVRVAAVVDTPIPQGASLEELRAVAAGCRNCDLWKRATQTVFGEGPRKARAILVGEQPGDEEDRTGHPFVGPAGRLLDQAMDDAGLVRKDVYVTNVVKHFKWKPAGKRRLHEKPRLSEINACLPWLEAEVSALAPDVIVCLGATAAQAVIGKTFRVTRERGVFVPSRFGTAFGTVHPSSILRASRRGDAATRAGALHRGPPPGGGPPGRLGRQPSAELRRGVAMRSNSPRGQLSGARSTRLDRAPGGARRTNAVAPDDAHRSTGPGSNPAQTEAARLATG